MDTEEYTALRAEILSRHTIAANTYAASLGLLAAIVGFAKPQSGNASPGEIIAACLMLQTLLVGASLVIRSMFRGTTRIGTYIETFHEGQDKFWETGNSRHGVSWYFSNQCRAMALTYIVTGLFLFMYSCYLLIWKESGSQYGVAAVVFLGCTTSLQLLAAASLWRARNRQYRTLCATEWQRLHQVLRPAERENPLNNPTKDIA